MLYTLRLCGFIEKVGENHFRGVNQRFDDIVAVLGWVHAASPLRVSDGWLIENLESSCAIYPMNDKEFPYTCYASCNFALDRYCASAFFVLSNYQIKATMSMR